MDAKGPLAHFKYKYSEKYAEESNVLCRRIGKMH